MNNKTNQLHEFDVVQNLAIGAVGIFYFANEFYKKTGELRGPDIALCMLILPLIFNRNFVKSAHRRGFSGGLYKVVNEDMAIFSGLQERMEKMQSISIRSINLCFTSRLLTMDMVTYEILPIRSKLPKFLSKDI